MSGQLAFARADRSLHARGTGTPSRFDRTDVRDVLALFVLGIASAVVCVTTSGFLQFIAAVVALTSPLMGRSLLRELARLPHDSGALDGC
jgi:hypothetical protein